MSSADELGTRPHVVSTLNRKLKVAINPRLINKNEADDKTPFTQGWENVELTPRELVAKIQQGIAYCAQLSGPRKASNFLAADFISVDIDDGKPIEELLRDAVVAQHATTIYTTHSHTPDAPRYRIVFALPRTITDAKEAVAAARSLTLRLAGDPAATDATRISFGSTDASVWLFDRQIGDELLEQLIAQSPRRPRHSVSGSSETIRCDLIPPDLQVKLRDGTVRAFTEVSPQTTICCPFHNDRRPSAFVVTSKAGVNGIHCATEKVTFWPPGTNHDVDFAEFEKTAREAQEYFKENQDWGWMNEGLGLTDVHEGLKRAHIHIVEGQPAPAELGPGVTFVKSPKGSGKTEAVKSLITGKNRVLLIGHRRALIKQSCQRLDLRSYLDAGVSFHGRVGICLDSLTRVPRDIRYDTVILDESEQLLAHFLSETIERRHGGGRLRLFSEFERILRDAKRIIALDADLGWISFRTLCTLIGPTGSRLGAGDHGPAHLWLNSSKDYQGKKIKLFDLKANLVAELEKAAAEGKRCFVTSNSKAMIEDIDGGLEQQFGSKVKRMKVTSDTVGSVSVDRFLCNIVDEARKCDVILCSPSVGTGVDIRFPKSAKVIDAVFGFFEPLITSHFECDQQLARVRDPGQVNVWVSSRRFQFDTHPEAIKHELLRESLYVHLLEHYDEHGAPVYRESQFIDMAALILAQRRASLNDLRKYFVQYKRSQGYNVEFVDREEVTRVRGNALLRAGHGLAGGEYVNALLRASTLTKMEFEDIAERLEAGEPVSDSERRNIERTRIELFYRQPISEQLIKLDDRGKLRNQFGIFELVTDHMLQQVAWQAQTIGNEARVIKSSVKVALTVLALLKRTRLMLDGHFDPERLIDLRDLEQFVEFTLANKQQIETQTDLDVRSDIRAKPTQMLGAILRLAGLRLKRITRIKIGGRRICRYKLDDAGLRLMQEVRARRKGTKAWSFLRGQYGWPTEAPGDEVEDALDEPA